jgi:peptidoglycan/LPS O-acetylase OafA/YrhL
VARNGRPTGAPDGVVARLRRGMSYEEFRGARAFPGLDGLRAVAATIVVIFHFGGPAVYRLQGWVGVQIFFALSGFLITSLALREVARTGRLDFRAFYLRRFFRIVPVYLVVLAVVVVQARVNRAGQTELDAALPYYLTFLGDLAPHAAYSHTWTLGIEQKFYLLWPLLAFGLAARTRGRAVAALLVIAVLAPLWDVRLLHASSFIVLLLGSLLALAMHHRLGFAVLRPLLSPAGAVLAAVAVVLFHLQFTGILERIGEPRAIPLYGVAVCLLLPAVIGPGPLRWVLSRRPMVFLGQRSYSMYLVQLVAGTAVAGLFPALSVHQSPGRALAVWVVSLLLADLLYRGVEQPMIEVGRRLARRTPGRGRPRGEGRDSAVRPVPASSPGPVRTPVSGLVTLPELSVASPVRAVSVARRPVPEVTDASELADASGIPDVPEISDVTRGPSAFRGDSGQSPGVAGRDGALLDGVRGSS